MRKALLILTTGLMLLLPGVVSGGGDLRRPQAAGVAPSDAQVRRLAAGNRAFAVRLYHHLNQQEGNLFYSPYSISGALAMAYAGARGNTERQMAQALNFYLPQSQLHPAFHLLGQQLATRGQGAMGTKGQPFRLHLANALWAQQGEQFLPAYLQVVERSYDAGVRQVDFAKSEAARATLNEWVARETQQKIPDLLPPGALSPLTRLVLTNAIYFNAAWQTQFQKQATKPGPFTLLDGKKVTVDLMHGNLRGGYAAKGDYELVDLPYQGGDVAMTILLPKPGRFAQVERALTAAQLEALSTYLKPTELELALPKFKQTSSFSLSRTLARLGMPQAFTTRADFSGMNGKRDLLISEVVHKALVDVNEEGTEAAAATAVIMRTTALPAKPVRVTVDRPFIFLIRDVPTGAVLFMGRVVQPGK